MRIPISFFLMMVVLLSGPAVASDSKEQAEEVTTAQERYRRMMVMKGQWLFERNCAFCHEKNGTGSVGPNLTDHYFIYGPDERVIGAIIREGIPAKGMPTWKEILPASDIRAIEKYVHTLIGKDLKGKEPQGGFFPLDEGEES